MAAASRRNAGAAAAPLVLEGQRSPRACPNASPALRLVGPYGFAGVNCKRRSCPVCGPKRDRETARVLVLDAREESPTVCITLTSADPDLPASVYREGSRQLWRALRARFGRVEYFAAIEFTTGRAKRSGGRRRMHGHHLVKGIPTDRVLEAEAIVREVWKRTTGAIVVDVAALVSPGAALGYLSLHHRKPQQQPPAGWRGMVERHSQGYFHRPIAELREQARRELAAEWIAHRDEIPLSLAALEVEMERDRWAAHRTRVIRVHDRGALVEPAAELGAAGSDRYRRESPRA